MRTLFCQLVSLGLVYAGFVDPETTMTAFSCDLDANITYSFTSSTTYSLAVVTVGTCRSDDGSDVTLSQNAGSFTVTAKGTCLTEVTSGANAGQRYGGMDAYYGIGSSGNLIIGKTIQTLTCNTKRTASVSFEFSTVSLKVKAEGDEASGYSIFKLTRLDDGWMPHPSTAATSGEKMMFDLNWENSIPQDAKWNVGMCKLTAGINTYTLFDLYDADCVEDFLTTIIHYYASDDKYYFSYTAFTFSGDDESNLILTCDMVLCDSVGSSGYCDKENGDEVLCGSAVNSS